MTNSKLFGVCAALFAASLYGADLYVDHLLGHDSYAGTLARPKKTIQAAINAASAGDTIHVAPGTYSPFSMDRRLTVIGTKGPSKTFIDGGNKYRCVKFADIDGHELHGFTLQNGYSGKEHGGGAWKGVLRHCVIRDCRTFDGNGEFGGGGVYLSHLYDCIVEGCHAGFGGAMHEGLAHRCTFRKNHAWDRGGAIWGAIVHHSLIHDNWCHNFSGRPGGAGAHGAWLYNCTVARNEVRRLAGAGGLHACYSYNCIVWANRNPAFPAYAQYRDHVARFDHFNSDPRFVAPNRFDFHLRHDSPCRRIADRTRLPDWQSVRFDRDRNPRFHGTTLDMGCYEEEEELNSVKPAGCGTYEIKYNPMGEEFVSVTLDGVVQLSSPTNGVFVWQPQTLGTHTNIFSYGLTAITNFVEVTSFPYAVQADPEPPMAQDNRVVITPLTRNIKQTGASYTVTTTGSTANWQAAVSADWIALTATEGEAGYPVAYMVGMNTNAETRVGYVYVGGHTHTITQAGVGSTLDHDNAQFESEGGEGEIALSIDQRHIWKARPNVDWISVSPTNGMSNGTITYTVAPLYDVTTRSGTITAGGNTFTVFQYGRRMGLSSYSETRDYFTHVIPVTVNALAITEWEVTPNNSWISVVDAGSGKGADLVTIAISENPSFQERTGTVTIGTETFRIIQEGRTDITFSIDPVNTEASANGANGLVAIAATPDLPWTAESTANWMTIYTPYATGAGNGNVAYTAFPNTTVYGRTGTILITHPDGAGAIVTNVHTATQPAANVALSLNGYEFAAAGESVQVTVTVSKNVQWSVEGVEDIAWLGLNGASTYVGPATITLAASSNESIYDRSGAITVAGKTFSVSQKGRGVELDYENVVFDTEGGWDSISVHPDGAVSWTAVSSDPTWITITAGGSGTGDGEVLYTVSDYVGDGGTRTGTITIGDKVVTIVQTAYPVSISPAGQTVAGNSGAGEISVAADINAVWNAIATEPWITIVTGQTGDGSGRVTFTYTENATGKTRTGKIVINGAEYTLTQQSRTLVAVNGEIDGHGGAISNTGSYDLGARVSIQAVADEGYVFSYWTLPDGTESMVNPLSVVADVPKTYIAKFAPNTPELTTVVSGAEGVTLNWNNLPWALRYHIWRGSSSVPAEAVEIDVIENNASATYVDTTGQIGLAYFYWVEAEGQDDRTMSAEAKAGTHLKPVIVSKITYANLKGATHANPTNYQEETTVVFSNPSAVTGYTFAGWEPASIGAAMTGDVVVRATWTANAYTVVYHANGGSGTIPATLCAYDEYLTLAAGSFVWEDHEFLGWATSASASSPTYQAGTSLLNLTAVQNGVVELYAVWREIEPEITEVAAPVIAPADGTTFMGESCTVTIFCDTPGASIYYSTNGVAPRIRDANLYTGPFAIYGTATIVAAAKYGDLEPKYATATITRTVVTLADAVDAPALAFTTGGAAWSVIPGGAPSSATDFCARSGVLPENTSSYLETTVSGAGTFSFKWKADCEHDPLGTAQWAHLSVATNGVEAARIDGSTGWLGPVSFEFGGGANTIRWTYVKPAEAEAVGTDAGYIDAVAWTPAGAAPAVVGDPGATVAGDATSGYTVTPSAGNTAVEVAIPSGIDASKVTVEVGTGVATVKPNGAAVKVVKAGFDITPFLDIPNAVGGVIAVGSATVKPEIARESLDPSKGAVINLTAASPVLTTPPTRPGLTYTLREGATLGAMADGASKVGDGQPWTPPITVKGGPSGFYSIRVEK